MERHLISIKNLTTVETFKENENPKWKNYLGLLSIHINYEEQKQKNMCRVMIKAKKHSSHLMNKNIHISIYKHMYMYRNIK